MKCAIAIRGRHDIVYYKTSFTNYTDMLFKPLREMGWDLTVFLLTYESPHVTDLLTDYNPAKSLILPSSEMNRYDTWTRQRFWHGTSIEMIHAYEKENTMQFDFFINIRFDLALTPKLFQSIQSDKINICYKHPSGNCDDNFFLFSRAHFANFKSAVEELIKRGSITHEICRFLPEGSIHYLSIVPHSGGSQWKEIFDILRAV